MSKLLEQINTIPKKMEALPHLLTLLVAAPVELGSATLLG